MADIFERLNAGRPPTRPIAILGAGTLGRRIALMLATRGAEVRLYARSAATRDAGVAFAREQLPAVCTPPTF